MKKIFIFSFLCLLFAGAYNVYASLNNPASLPGCEDDPRIECRVFVSTPGGGAVIKEPGINKMSVEEEI